METRASPFIVGLFTLGTLFALIAFTYWYSRFGEGGPEQTYRVVFADEVTGLGVGAPVLFNGIKVGSVEDMGLAPDDPTQIVARITVGAATPVRVDTRAQIQSQGFTGVPFIQLISGRPDAPELTQAWGGEGAPIIYADASTVQSIIDRAQSLMTKLDTAVTRVDDILAGNQAGINNSIRNIEKFSAALAERSDAIGSFMDDAAAVARRLNALGEKLETLSTSLQERLDVISPDSVRQTVENVKTFTAGLADQTDELKAFISDAGAAVYNQTEYLHIIDCDDSDPNTVVFTWEGPYAPYASLFDTVLPKHVLEGQDVVTYDAYNRSPLGTGPFKFVEWKTGEYVRVEKNENYWRGPEYPKLDGVIVQFIPDPNTRVNALKAGEYDFGQILPNQVAEVSDLEGYKVELVNTNSWLHFDFNVATDRGQALFGDKAVRQAIAHAIDRESIVNDLMEGTVELANTGITPNSPYFNEDVTVYNYDPEQAAQMLDEAGWTVGSDGIREKDGERLSFTIINRNSRPERVAIAQVIQANLKDVGVEVNFENLENAAWLERWLSKDWEAVVGGWIIPADPSLTSLYGCEASNNFTGFCSEELDAAMEASDQVLDFAERKPLVDEVQAILAEEAWALPLYYAVNPYVLREDFENFKGSGTNLGSYWNSYEWDFGN